MSMRDVDSTLPSKTEIVVYWRDCLHLKGIWIDWGEPSCWACGWGWSGRYDCKHADASWEQMLRGWERAPLQRCHILPRSLGGSDDASNLLLMCRECHDLAPNTSNTAFFFSWAARQNWLDRMMLKLKTELDPLGMTENQMRQISVLVESENFQTWLLGNVGIHFPQSGYSTLLSRVTAASGAAAIQKYNEDHPRVIS